MDCAAFGLPVASVVSYKKPDTVAPTFRACLERSEGSARAGLKASATSNAVSSYFRDTTLEQFDTSKKSLMPVG